MVIEMKKKYLFISYIISFGLLFVACPVFADTGCEVFDPDFLSMLGSVFKFLKIATPIILIVLTTIDFAKSVILGEKDGMKKAKDNFVKRAIAAIIIFFIPDIVNLIFKIAGSADISKCISGVKG